MDRGFVNRKHLSRIAICGASALTIAAALAGCSNSPSGQTASASPSAHPTVATLPSLPKVAENTVVVREVRGTGRYSFRSNALSSRSLTAQFACAGPAKTAVSVRLFQGGVKPIYQIGHQPCDGMVQRISLTVDATTPLKTFIDAPKGTRYGILITQG